MSLEYWKNYQYGWGLAPRDIGTTFERNGVSYEIVGCDPKSRRKPILVKNLKNGKVVNFKVDTVKYFAFGWEGPYVSARVT